eukprot:TRINITY_DN5998_c0_g3_i5.p1 TRINITY_DN5998_c0_g3~~TRINITY_DN5998_c0_g3_i5.p1  ORF type:complete len:477 (+),score=100.61 TRINITY_DN5998_c0_g3_i5:127-1557(+)
MVLDATDADVFYLLVSGYLVFFMQCGFAMLSAGSVRSKNAMNIILKNLLDACFGALGWYLIGFALAYGEGDDPNPFIGGQKYYALSNANESVNPGIYANWFFQYAFAATAATIVSGAVAERTRFEAYLCYAFLLTSFVYPVVVYWVWNANGFLSFTNDKIGLGHGMIDFAGCGVVHMTGGFAGLWGAVIVGPRLGRFDSDGKPVPIPGHNASLAILGVFILWFGWYGFNPGSTLGLSGLSLIASRCAVTTTLSAATATMTTLFATMLFNYLDTGVIVWELICTSNGTLGGLVGITAACAVVQPWAAVIIGFLSAFVYIGASRLVSNTFKVDDPLDAVAVHGFCGLWGLLATAAFADQDLVTQVYGGDFGNSYGFLNGGNGKLLGAALLGITVIFGWVSVFMVTFFIAMKYLGLLRVTQEEELSGLDTSHHGGDAYPLQPGEKSENNLAYVNKQLLDIADRVRLLESNTTNNSKNAV